MEARPENFFLKCRTNAVQMPYTYMVLNQTLTSAHSIHPTAAIVANSIVIPSVPVHVFHMLQSLLPSIPATVSWRLGFIRKRRKRGRLTITMPTYVHEAFFPFSQDMADQLCDSHFLPPQYKRGEILQSGSTQLKHGLRGLVPDAGISFFHSRNTFLVLEVAYSQKEKDAQHKAQRYILDTDGKTKFVVLVIVTKKPRKNMANPLSSDTALQLLQEDNLSPDYDTVHVHVYKAVIKLLNILTGEHPINKLQIFPGLAPDDTFTITWADINCGPWAKFRDGAKLLPETPEPTCAINFSALVSIARSLANQADDLGEGTTLYHPEYTEVATPSLKKETFVDGSSPAVHLSSGGTVPSEKERRLDPDYQPSFGSDGSCDSLDWS